MGSDLVGGAGPAGSQAVAQNESIPIYTYLMNAGLSPADVKSAGDEIRKRVREKIRQKAMGDDPDTQRRYLTDAAYRAEVNAQIVGEVVVSFGFELQEVREIDRGLRLGLQSAPTRRGPPVAHVKADGIDEDFEILDLSDRPVVRSRKDGQLYRF